MGSLYEITPFTLLDFPGETACVAWFAGCNLRCVYCHNPAIVSARGEKEVDELLAFLERRKGLLSGVVFSGGEATFFPGLAELAAKAKALGYKVKLDTNGSRPEVLTAMLDRQLLDYVALDYKCPRHRALDMLGTAQYVDRFYESLDLLAQATGKGLKLEVRTTVHADLLSEAELNGMIGDLERVGYRGTYYIQNVVSYGSQTIGNVPQPSRTLDLAQLDEPSNFNLAFRNFPPQKLPQEPSS